MRYATVCFERVVNDIEQVPAAHIHEASVDDSGPVVVTLLMGGEGGLAGGAEADRELVRDILQNPEDSFVNVDNPDLPAEALRGQLG